MVSLTGKDTSIIDDRVLNDFGDGDVVNIEFPNNLVEGKVGKNGNVLYAYNSTGNQVTVTMRLLRGSPDDKFFNTKMIQYKQNPAGFILMEGEFIKKVGDGKGNITDDIYKLSGGIIQKMVGGKENVEGDTEQSLSIYQFFFANTDRIES
jgi:hypothetical protein